MNQSRCDLKDGAIPFSELCTATFASPHVSLEPSENAHVGESFRPLQKLCKSFVDSE